MNHFAGMPETLSIAGMLCQQRTNFICSFRHVQVIKPKIVEITIFKSAIEETENQPYDVVWPFSKYFFHLNFDSSVSSQMRARALWKTAKNHTFLMSSQKTKRGISENNYGISASFLWFLFARTYWTSIKYFLTKQLGCICIEVRLLASYEYFQMCDSCLYPNAFIKI